MKIIGSIFFVLLYISGFSQIPEIVWQQCFGDPEDNSMPAVETTEYGYIFGIDINSGENVTNYHGDEDIWIFVTDSSYNMIWEKCYGGSKGEVPHKIININNNEYYILGSTASVDGDVQSGNNGFNDMWVIKINDQGGIIWEQTYGCTGYDNIRDIILTPDGGFVMIDRIGVGGGDVTNFYGVGDVWMCKCDSLGNIEWEKSLGNHGLDNGVSMMINSQDNIMMIGATKNHGGMVECYPDEAWGDVWLVELDLLGNIISQHCYGGSDYELGYDIEEIEDGYIFIASSYSNDGDVTGHHGPSGGSDAKSDYWVVKINSSGEIIWQKSLGGYKGDNPVYITQTEDGFLAIGTTFSNDGDVSGNHSFPNTYADIWAIKLTPEGEIGWQHCYGGWGMELLYNPYTILKKDDYNYVIASSTNYKSWNDDIQCDIHANYDYDAWIFEIDIDDTTGIFDTPVEQGQVKVYPNPARDYVVFEFEVRSSEFEVWENKEIRIIDTFGQQVTLLPVKSEKTVWDTRAINNGMYFYSIEINGKVLCGKIVIEK